MAYQRTLKRWELFRDKYASTPLVASDSHVVVQAPPSAQLDCAKHVDVQQILVALDSLPVVQASSAQLEDVWDVGISTILVALDSLPVALGPSVRLEDAGVAGISTILVALAFHLVVVACPAISDSAAKPTLRVPFAGCARHNKYIALEKTHRFEPVDLMPHSAAFPFRIRKVLEDHMDPLPSM